MTSVIEKRDFGDGARLGIKLYPNQRSSDHVFDGAGENVQYYSDSESTGSRKSRTRYINPAIYIEPVESARSVASLHADSSSVEDITPHPHSTYRSNSTPLLPSSSRSSGSITRKSCRLPGDEETPRFDRTYREDREEGADTFRLSVASVSTTTTAKQERERNERKRQEAFEAWLARKEQERQEKIRLEKLKQKVVTKSNPSNPEKTFRRWLESKRTHAERQRAEEILRQFRSKERQEKERSKREKDKEEKLSEWARRKEEQQKAVKTKEEVRANRAMSEQRRRRSEGERAYRDWLRTSRNKPLPVPLNQGELSMRGSVSQMFINPIPWESQL